MKILNAIAESDVMGSCIIMLEHASRTYLPDEWGYQENSKQEIWKYWHQYLQEEGVMNNYENSCLSG